MVRGTNWRLHRCVYIHTYTYIYVPYSPDRLRCHRGVFFSSLACCCCYAFQGVKKKEINNRKEVQLNRNNCDYKSSWHCLIYDRYLRLFHLFICSIWYCAIAQMVRKLRFQFYVFHFFMFSFFTPSAADSLNKFIYTLLRFFFLSFLFGARVICSRMISAATVQPLIAVHLREQSTGLSCTYLNRTISCSVSQANSICLSRDSIEIIQWPKGRCVCFSFLRWLSPLKYPNHTPH